MYSSCGTIPTKCSLFLLFKFDYKIVKNKKLCVLLCWFKITDIFLLRSCGYGLLCFSGTITRGPLRAEEHPLWMGSYCVDFCPFVPRSLQLKGLRKPPQTVQKSPALQQSSVGTANYHYKRTLAGGKWLDIQVCLKLQIVPRTFKCIIKSDT